MLLGVIFIGVAGFAPLQALHDAAHEHAPRDRVPLPLGIAMLQRIFASALGAGLAVGLIVAVLQHAALVPLILHAEKYEDGTLTVPHKHSRAPATDIGAAVAGGRCPVAIGAAQAHDGAADAKDESSWRAVADFRGDDAHRDRLCAAARRRLCGEWTAGRRARGPAVGAGGLRGICTCAGIRPAAWGSCRARSQPRLGARQALVGRHDGGDGGGHSVSRHSCRARGRSRSRSCCCSRRT